MRNIVPEIIVLCLLVAPTGFLFIFNKSLSDALPKRTASLSYSWFQDLIINLFGYCTILLPGYLVYLYIEKAHFVARSENKLLVGLLRMCFGETDKDVLSSPAATVHVQRSNLQECFLLTFCLSGLLVSFVIWGFLQEKVMTQEYFNAEGVASNFKNSQFLVFVNRILAFAVSGLVVMFTSQPRHRAPLYKYVYCSLSNIISSWCQYEALKYVTFPHQVLAKASKVIPVMIMSKIMSRVKYENYEYITAVILSIGMLFFMLDTGNQDRGSSVTTFSGIIILLAYIAFDSFTSNWQGKLYSQYAMSPVQMMCAVNLFSFSFTAISLLQQGSFFDSFDFLSTHPKFFVDCIFLSLCSAIGQLFIFFTISKYGAVVFTIITTLRQAISILLSCVYYNHPVHALGLCGVLLVFASVFLRVYCKQRLKAIKKKQQTNAIKV